MEFISQNLLLVILSTFFVITGILSFVLIGKFEEVDHLRKTLSKLKRSFNDLDEQAKLIVKTDLELNKAQEELDKRLNSLDALQRTSRLISTTLDQNEIFHRLDRTLMASLGFEKNAVFTFDLNKKMHTRVILGYTTDEANMILSNMEKDVSLINALKEGHTFSSVNSPKQRIETISRLFSVEHFVISPILTKNGFLGIIFVGNLSNAAAVTEGDEELTSILANQIGQSLENAQLFEEVYRSSQQLESKVQDRTKQLASALKEVQKVSKTKSEFISAVSHELRTPLTSIKGYASLLMTGKLGEIPDKVKDRLEKINIHSDNLVKLINDLLDISRIESGRVEMSFTECNLKEIIASIQDLLTPQMKDKNIKFVSDISEQVPNLMLDHQQIERVFINLVGNAIKFTPVNGTITVQVLKEKRTDPLKGIENDMIVFHVSDTGIGIKKEDIEKLFDEFYRVDNEINQSVKGTGLGLPLTKKIIEAHGGNIWVTSKLKEGTTFHFALPFAQN